MYENDNLADCAYRDIGLSRTEDADPPFTYHYCRSVFDWSCDREILAALCEWHNLFNREPGLCGVYVVQCEDAPFAKIGISDNPEWRLGTLQSGHWQKLSLHAVLWVWNEQARDLESACHRVAAEQGAEVRREWVRLSPTDALDLVLAEAARLNLQASGTAGVMRTIQDMEAARRHVLKTQQRLAVKRRAVAQGY